MRKGFHTPTPTCFLHWLLKQAIELYCCEFSPREINSDKLVTEIRQRLICSLPLQQWNIVNNSFYPYMQTTDTDVYIQFMCICISKWPWIRNCIISIHVFYIMLSHTWNYWFYSKLTSKAKLAETCPIALYLLSYCFQRLMSVRSNSNGQIKKTHTVASGRKMNSSMPWP